MTKSEFIKKHRSTIDAAINAVKYGPGNKGGRKKLPSPAPTYSDAERAAWLEHDEGLFLWAQAQMREHRRQERRAKVSR